MNWEFVRVCSMRLGCHCQWEEWREVAVADSWVSVTWPRSLGPEFHTSSPAGRIWELLKGKRQQLKWQHLVCVCMFAHLISPSPSLLKPYALMTSCWIWVATGSTSCSILPMSLQALSLASSMRAAFSGTEKAWITSVRTTAMDGTTVWLSLSHAMTPEHMIKGLTSHLSPALRWAWAAVLGQRPCWLTPQGRFTADICKGIFEELNSAAACYRMIYAYTNQWRALHKLSFWQNTFSIPSLWVSKHTIIIKTHKQIKKTKSHHHWYCVVYLYFCFHCHINNRETKSLHFCQEQSRFLVSCP